MEYKQAIAFIESIIGWEDTATEQSKPKSPHARTHLEAVLGMQFSLQVNSWSDTPSGNLEKLGKIADYLVEVGSSIKSNLPTINEGE